MNKEKVRQLFDTKAPTLLLSEGEEDEDFDMQDFAYDLASEVDASEYISFTPSFVRDCNYFYNEITKTSDEWESQDWNDEQFENDKEWNSWGESKKDNSKRMTENDKYIGDVASFKKMVNDVCEWACNEMDDRDALFFGVGMKGILVKGKLLEVYVDRVGGDVEAGWNNLMDSYNSETGHSYGFKLLDFHGFPGDEVSEIPIVEIGE